MQTHITETRTRTGVFLPNGVETNLAQPVESMSKNLLWEGTIPVNNPDQIQQIVPHGISLRNEIIALLERYIPYYKRNPRSHSSYTMLLPATGGQTPSILEILKLENNRGCVNILYNPPIKTIKRLERERRVFRR